MKKSKKMALTKETLRVLDEGTLADVEGGLTPIVLTTAAVVGYTIGKYTI
ncbi:MAG TPA: class I lanthipeptide [Thermoanaerobaculia bacterium]|nr:class I lanthipeptide [Thermoanaerobaculia bacterium]